MNRELLGAADVSDGQLSAMVADLLDVEHAEVSDVVVEPVAYDLPAITTAGRYWVSGTAQTPQGIETFRLFVKHVQAWSRHPFFAQVPDSHREMAAASVPWRTEPLAYRSDLGDRLPEGLSMPRALGVFELPDEQAAIWLQEVRHTPVEWDLARYTRAAYLLGRTAASERVRPLADVGDFEWSVWNYVHGRIDVDILPGLAERPTLDPDLHARLLAAAALVPAYAEELMAFPRVAGHGDACPNNLLPGPDIDSFVLIDFGFWMSSPLAFDLGQLVAGDVQLGRCGITDLTGLDEACVAAYTRGLAEEGMVCDVADVRRAHALQLFLFVGISIEVPELVQLSLDLLEETEPRS